MVEVTYQMFLSTLQTVGILVGIVYYLIIMRNSQRNQELTLKTQEQAVETRQAQLFMNIYNQILRKEFTQDWYIVTYERECKPARGDSKDAAQLISVLARAR